ncbi:MAG TPA: hypothetical protein VFH78_01695 [Candidatus Thermoplasmatota archaeon]|nr:hypothetical protein [Candidatus Thermoplasmatota archaeon]
MSNRQKAALAVALALLLWAPSGVSHGDVAVVTGHSTFYDGDTFSPCLASIAGIMRHRVMWFNDQVLVETYGGAGTFIYVTEQGAPDPRKASKLYTDGVFYDFVDPNGAHWHIEELYYDITDDVTVNATLDRDEPWQSEVRQVSVYGKRTMVWVVELAPRPIFDEFAGADPHTYYNFLVLVDTCKIHSNDINTSYDGIANHNNESGLLNDKYGHQNGEDPHTHERYMMDLWVGKRPLNVVPNGASVDGAEWTSNWAYQETAGGADEHSGGVYGGLAP